MAGFVAALVITFTVICIAGVAVRSATGFRVLKIDKPLGPRFNSSMSIRTREKHFEGHRSCDFGCISLVYLVAAQLRLAGRVGRSDVLIRSL